MKSGIRILIADDEEGLREVVAQVLSDDGHDVTKSSCGEEALEIFRKDPFPLVISDIIMNGMSGIELLQKIKQLRSETEVILVTSYALIDTAIAALRHGAYDYIMKTYDNLDSISAIVNRAAEKIRCYEENRKLIEKLKRENTELEHSCRTFKDSAVLDELTRLYNQRYFRETLAVELNRSLHFNRSFSLIFFDVELNGQGNSSPGPEEKTHMLRTVARIVKQRLRNSDLLVRFDEERFAVILPETPRDGACRVAGCIRQLLTDQSFQGQDVRRSGKIAVNTGIVVFPEDGTDGTALIQRADDALRREKGA